MYETLLIVSYTQLSAIHIVVNHKCGYRTQMVVSGNQIRAARALIGMDQRTLAERAGVGINTVRNLEAHGAESVRARTDTLGAILDALKEAGVIFVDENGAGPGVRLKKSESGARH